MVPEAFTKVRAALQNLRSERQRRVPSAFGPGTGFAFIIDMQSRCGIKSLVLVLGAAGLLTACGSAPNCGSATGATVSRDMDRKATKKATPTPVPTPPTPPPITPPAAAPTPTPTPVPAGAITQRSPLDQSSECPTATSNKCTNNLYDGSCS